MYTDLPKVTAAAGIFKNDLNMMQRIKVKLLRAGLFSITNLLSFPVNGVFHISSVDSGLGTSIHLEPAVSMTDQAARQSIAMIFYYFLTQRIQWIKQLLTPNEQEYLSQRLDMLFSIESFPGCYVVRI